MTRLMSRREREEKALGEAKAAYRAMEAWRDAHPDASYAEFELALREERRGLMGRFTEILINGRETGAQADAPRCRVCGEDLEFEGYRRRTIHGLECDATLERAYYVCPGCGGQAIFPPGPEVETAKG